MTKNDIKRGKDYDVPDPLMKDAHRIIQNAIWVSIAVMLAEGLRKQDLHVSGVPLFVLDNEPIITISSYGLVFSAVMLALCTYVLLIGAEDLKMKKETVVTLRKVRWPISAMIFIIFVFWQLRPYVLSSGVYQT